MNDIGTIGIIGCGALGTLFAHTFAEAIGYDRTLILADAERTRRYQKDGIIFNGELCPFRYVNAEEYHQAVDLLLFGVKSTHLPEAVLLAQENHLVCDETTIISVLNGISSEGILSVEFSPEQVVWTVAQKMSAMKIGNTVQVDPLGELAIGMPDNLDDSHFQRLIEFFNRIHFPYSTPENIELHMWSKLLCNVGCNQACMVYECGYGGVQTPGSPARETMLAAMRETAAVGQAAGIPLSEKDVEHWTKIIDSFPPDGMPSMRQDALAHRKSEVGLFAGTICQMGRQRQIPTPVNNWLRQRIQEMEQAYS